MTTMNNNTEMQEVMHVCADCGEEFAESAMREVDGEWYCEDCFDERFTVCARCGEIIEQDEAYFSPDGEPYCEDCFNDNCVVCERCGETIWSDNAFEVRTSTRGATQEWCEDCADNYATRCEDCGEWFSDSINYIRYVLGVERNVCEDCLSESGDYTICDGCGEWYHVDDITTDDDGDEYCPRCWRNLNNERAIYGYHNYPSGHHWYRLSRPNETDRYKNLYFGVELEIDRGGESNEKAKTIKEAFNLRGDYDITCMHDGSLDNGFELISQPATLQYHLKDYGWQKAMKKAEQLGYVSHNGGTCGLHVHVDREYFNGSFENPEDSFVILTQNNLDWLKTFSRRKRWNYCQFMNRSDGYEFTPESFKGADDNTALEYISNVRNSNRGHGVAMNYAGYATIEFRFFRGTLKFQSFAASLQLVEMMCYAAKHFRKEQLCNVNLKWFKRFAKRRGYDEFNAYIAERGIMA